MQFVCFYDPSIPIHVECARFCFTGILQTELDETLKLWNTHYVRRTRNSECPPGRPDVLFYAPGESNGTDCKFDVARRDIDITQEFVTELPIFSCLNSSLQLFQGIMSDRHFEYPTDVTSAKSLFLNFIEEIDARRL